MAEEKTKLWYEDTDFQYYIFTDEDIKTVLKLLDEKRGASFGEKTEEELEYDKIFCRIMIQMKGK